MRRQQVAYTRDAGQIRRVRCVLVLAHGLACPGPVVAERGAERLGGGSGLVFVWALLSR